MSKPEKLDREVTGFRHLFSEGAVGPLRIANRFVRSATAEDLEVYRANRVPETTIDLYRRLAGGRVGLLIFSAPVPMPRTYGPGGEFADWKANGDRYRREGADFVPRAVREVWSEATIIGSLNAHIHEKPSKIRAVFSPTPAPEMTLPQIRQLAESFSIAIVRMKEEGYDGAQLHAGHGAILGRFISPYTNRREDAYGGSLERRMRILREIVDGAREVVGEFPILIKANATDYLDGGVDETLFPRIAEELQRIGFDAIEITGGMWACLVRTDEELGFRPVPAPESHTGIAGDVTRQSYFLPFVRDVDVDIPLILTGGNRNVARLEEIVAEGRIDFVGMCRPLIREPELVDRWRRGAGDPEAECLACNSCIYLLHRSGQDGVDYRPDVCPARDWPAVHAAAQRWLSTWVERRLGTMKEA
jgi:2,4-dienoyl-CoA reductase-like NADH-dependent reductase (Old Yellow Enzyme family)